MKRLRTVLSAGGLAAAIGIGSLALSAPSVFADGSAPDYPGSVLHISIPGPKVAGRPITIVATGSNQASALGTPIDYDLFIFLVNPKLLQGGCATSMETEENNVTDTAGGRQLNFAGYNEGESGTFNIDVPFTPGGGGKLLVCAYSEYVTDDAAWASTQAVIGGIKPADTSRPTVTRRGRELICAHGSWSGKPSSYSYRWKLDGKINGDRRSILKLRSSPHGTAVCTVIATSSNGSGSASSRAIRLSQALARVLSLS